MLNNLKLINLSKDKWKSYEYFTKKEVSVIPTTIFNNSWSETKKILGSPPFFIKPRKGSGSEKTNLIKDKLEFDFWRYKLKDNDFIIQKYIKGDEYTAASFGINGDLSHPIIFKRKLKNTGTTQWAEVVNDAKIQDFIKNISKYFDFQGPTNFQFIKSKNKIYLLEINPRISSSTSIRAEFGYNESIMSVDYFLNNKKIEIPLITKGKAVRYLNDLVL